MGGKGACYSRKFENVDCEINISYWMVKCIVSQDIFTSHAVLRGALRASQNIRDE